MAFMLLIANWASFWRYSQVESWGELDVLIPLVFVSVLYAFCDLVIPDQDAAGETLDLCEYLDREGKRYKKLQLIVVVLSTIYIAHTTSSFVEWLASAKFAIIAGLITLVALRARRVWLDTVTAAALAVEAAIFMSIRLQAF
jgi:hypothetical protein